MLSEKDAEYIAEKNRRDLVALTWSEKEALSLIMEEHLSKLFKKRVNVPSPSLAHSTYNFSRIVTSAITKLGLFPRKRLLSLCASWQLHCLPFCQSYQSWFFILFSLLLSG